MNNVDNCGSSKSSFTECDMRHQSQNKILTMAPLSQRHLTESFSNNGEGENPGVPQTSRTAFATPASEGAGVEKADGAMPPHNMALLGNSPAIGRPGGYVYTQKRYTPKTRGHTPTGRVGRSTSLFRKWTRLYVYGRRLIRAGESNRPVELISVMCRGD